MRGDQLALDWGRGGFFWHVFINAGQIYLLKLTIENAAKRFNYQRFLL
jgi:hypothetical protein